MQQYLDVLRTTLEHGYKKGDRTGTGTTAFFGMQRRFWLHKAFKPILPTVTTKFIHLDSVIHELLWMLSGDTRLEYLIANGVRIWNEWVLKGTEVWEPLSSTAIHKALCKEVGTDTLDVVWCKNATVANGGPLTYNAGIDEHGEDVMITIDWKGWCAHDGKLYVDMEWFRKVDIEHKPYDDAPVVEVSIWLMDARLYKLVFEKEPRKLIGGDLGPVYGKTWRDIDDTRIILKNDWHKLEARGFDFVVDLPGVDMNSDRCVVTRKVDQLKELLYLLEKEPDSRRMIICAWDPRLIEDQALPPCHAFIQFFTRELSAEERLDYYTEMEDKRIKDQIEAGIMERGQGVPSSVESYRACMDLFRKERSTMEDYHVDLDEKGVPRRAISCQLYQRSADEFLGVPFNITFYSLMTHLLAKQFNMVAEEFIWTGGDCHIYSNHMEQVNLQLTREPFAVPYLDILPETLDIREVKREDVVVHYNEYHPHIAGKVAV